MGNTCCVKPDKPAELPVSKVPKANQPPNFTNVNLTESTETKATNQVTKQASQVSEQKSSKDKQIF
jgi:hypothetical protein